MNETSGSGFGLLPIIKRKRKPFFEGEYQGLDQTKSSLRTPGSAPPVNRKQEDGPGRGEVPIGIFGPKDEDQDPDLKPAPIGMAKIDGSQAKTITAPPPPGAPRETGGNLEGMALITAKASPGAEQTTPQGRFEALMAKAKPLETTEPKETNAKQSTAASDPVRPPGRPSGQNRSNPHGARRWPRGGNAKEAGKDGDRTEGPRMDGRGGEPTSPPSPLK